MRYYSVEIDGGPTYRSHPGGQIDPGALNVEFDIPVGPGASPVGSGLVRVWGIGLQDIAQAKNLSNKAIKVFGGMKPGLPLATIQAPEAGLLVQGQIYPAFGNWVATDMTLDLVIIPGTTGWEGNPANLVVQHKTGDKLGDVVKKTLSTAYPKLTPSIKVSDSLVLDHDGFGVYQSFEQFADIVRKMSLSIMNAGGFFQTGTYPGVNMVQAGDSINVYDGTQKSETKTVNFYDLLGQPTWIGVNSIQFKTVMRGDIAIGDTITMPPTIATTTAQSNPQLRDNSQFQGTFQVKQVRHIGNFRQPDGMSWNTTFDAFTDGTNGG